jgi:hypothetical protein
MTIGGVGGGITLPFLMSVLYGGKESASRSGRFTPSGTAAGVYYMGGYVAWVEDNIQMDIWEIGFDDRTWMEQTQVSCCRRC